MNIRLFNTKGHGESCDTTYSEDDKTIINVRSLRHYEVANEVIIGDPIYIGLECGVGDFGLVMYGEEKKLVSDINVLIGTLEGVIDELTKITPTTKQE